MNSSYIVSARKYRPTTFQSVVGQKGLTQTLKNAIESNKLAHAYLFCGPRGVGKTTCARIFAKTINCLNPTETGEACNACESCIAFNEGRSYNISELDAASNNSVDDIRNLTELVRIPPQVGRYKVYIVDEVHMLSASAFNAFLKTLEEPPHHALFILATTEKHKILPTILSRCQIYDFQRITIADTVEHLNYVATCEGATAESEALNVIAQKADGGMRDALSILDQVISFTAGHITYQAVIENLNLLDYEYYFKLVEAFLHHTVSPALLLLNEVLSRGFDAQYFVTGLSSHLRNLLVSQDPITLPLLEVAPSVAQRYGEQAARCDTNFLFKAIELSNSCDLNYRASRNKRLLVELMLIQVCQLGVAQPSPQGVAAAPLQQIAPTSPPPTAPQQQSPQSQAAPAVVTLRADAAPAKVAPKPPTKSIPSISIRKVAKQGQSQEEVQAAAKAVEMNTPFTQEQLREAWFNYTLTIPTEALLVNTLKSCPPMLQADGSTFEVVVDNQDQLRRLSDKGHEVLHFLKEHLKNSHLKMALRESEKREKVRAFSHREKYDLMVSINSCVTALTNRFGLELV